MLCVKQTKMQVTADLRLDPWQAPWIEGEKGSTEREGRGVDALLLEQDQMVHDSLLSG